MPERNDVVTTLRAHLKGAHKWLEGTLQGVNDEIANHHLKRTLAR